MKKFSLEIYIFLRLNKYQQWVNIHIIRLLGNYEIIQFHMYTHIPICKRGESEPDGSLCVPPFLFHFPTGLIFHYL